MKIYDYSYTIRKKQIIVKGALSVQAKDASGYIYSDGDDLSKIYSIFQFYIGKDIGNNLYIDDISCFYGNYSDKIKDQLLNCFMKIAIDIESQINKRGS